MERLPDQSRQKLSDAAGFDAGGGEDRLSALPDDVLIHIFLKLREAPLAGRTSVLARRWRRVWALLPELHFPVGSGPDSIRAALAAHDAPALSHLFVVATEVTPESSAAWLPIAARRLSGALYFENIQNMDEQYAASPLKLPCFQKATEIILDLGYTSLALPPSGIFTRLTNLELVGIQLHGPCSLGDAVSSPRCPSLRRLSVCSIRGLDKFTIHSESLLQLEMKNLRSLQQLNVVALALEELAVQHCFTIVLNQTQPVANISAPHLVTLDWRSAYNPSVVLFGRMAHLQQLTTGALIVYGRDFISAANRNSLMLLQHFEHISILILSLLYPPMLVKGNDQFLMEEMTKFHNITILELVVMACGHSFGAGSFHVLKMSSGIRELELKLIDTPSRWETNSPCQSGCICDEPSNWETEELVLHCLEEVEINGLKGTEHELALVKRLFNWTTMLKRMTINFHVSLTESKGKELGQLLLSVSRPGICMKFLHGGKACSCD